MTDIGYFTLILSLMLSFYSGAAAVIGMKLKDNKLIRSSESAVIVVTVLLSIASFILVLAFVNRDFQIEYVASYSSRSLSMLYTISGFWAGQKGSLLFWAWMMAIFSSILVLQNRNKNRTLMPYAVTILMVITFFFIILMVFVTNPFEKLAIIPKDGNGLNPMLQNPGMVFHPPTLLIGYVGFAIPFALGISALITGKLDSDWIRISRKWTIVSWIFLTIGNILGMNWAYVVLGWGGYWAWDPVENASFMPWLIGTAFLHSVMIQEKKDMLKIWNMILIMTTFLLTIFGTFITRSGLISSVHSFGKSNLGYMFLAFLLVATIFCYYLLFSRMDQLKSKNEFDSLFSRESSFLFNNLLLVGLTFTVFWGTIFPIISEAVKGVKITVGPPFFNQVTVPIFLLLLLLTGICPLIAWRRSSIKNFQKNFIYPLIATVAGLIVFLIIGIRDIYVLLVFSFSVFVIITIILEFYRGTKVRKNITNKSTINSFFSLISRNKRRFGGYIIHLGIVLIFIGVTGSSAYKSEKEVTLKEGESVSIKHFQVKYENLFKYQTEHKSVVGTKLLIFKDKENVATLIPRKDFYPKQKEPTTKVAIYSTLKEDLYVIFAGHEKNGTTASFKILIFPLVKWIWIGGFVMVFGAIITVWSDKKRKIQKSVMTEEAGQNVA